MKKTKMMKKTMIKTILMGLIMLLGCLTLAACGSSGEDVTYESIYEDYSSQLTEKGLELLEEYNSEASGVSDVTQLASLANDKVSELAEIQVEGGTKMAELMNKNSDEYSVYEENFKKLYQVYNDEAMKIYSAYMDKYASTIPGMTESMRQQMLDSFAAGLESMAPME